MKQINKMTKKELEDEYNGIVQSIEMTGYSCHDVMYRGLLEEEIYKRGYEIFTKYTIS